MQYYFCFFFEYTETIGAAAFGGRMHHAHVLFNQKSGCSASDLTIVSFIIQNHTWSMLVSVM